MATAKLDNPGLFIPNKDKRRSPQPPRDAGAALAQHLVDYGTDMRAVETWARALKVSGGGGGGGGITKLVAGSGIALTPSSGTATTETITNTGIRSVTAGTLGTPLSIQYPTGATTPEVIRIVYGRTAHVFMEGNAGSTTRIYYPSFPTITHSGTTITVVTGTPQHVKITRTGRYAVSMGMKVTAAHATTGRTKAFLRSSVTMFLDVIASTGGDLTIAHFGSTGGQFGNVQSGFYGTGGIKLFWSMTLQLAAGDAFHMGLTNSPTVGTTITYGAGAFMVRRVS